MPEHPGQLGAVRPPTRPRATRAERVRRRTAPRPCPPPRGPPPSSGSCPAPSLGTSSALGRRVSGSCRPRRVRPVSGFCGRTRGDRACRCLLDPDDGEGRMSQLLLLTNALQPSAEVLPALGLLAHQVRVAAGRGVRAARRAARRRRARRRPPRAGARPLAVPAAAHDRHRLPAAAGRDRGRPGRGHRRVGRRRRLLDTAGPAEVEARLRLAIGRLAAGHGAEDEPAEIRRGDLTIDEATYTAQGARAARST